MLPLGFPVRAGPQRGWLIAQLGLALGVTVAAAAVTALPPSRAGTVTVTGAGLEGGALAAAMAAFAVLAVTAQRPAPRLAWARCGAAVAIAAVTVAAIVGGKLPDRMFSAALATLIVAAAAVDGLLRRRRRMLQSHDQLGTPGTLGPAALSRPALDVLAATGGLLAGAVLAGFQIHRFHAGEDADPTRMAPPTDPLTGRAGRRHRPAARTAATAAVRSSSSWPPTH